MHNFAAMNEVWNAWVADGEKPARACVQAHMAREAILIETVSNMFILFFMLTQHFA